MAQKPPDDHDTLDPILRQIGEALSSLGLGDGALRSEVLDGVRDALHSLNAKSGVPVMLFGSEPEEPDEDDLSEESEGPELRVVDTEEVERFHQRQQRSEVQVRVLKPRPQPASLHEEGRISVRWEHGERPWQTVYRGETARPYRLACDQGELELSVDGIGVDRICEGQTVDLEARVIRLRAAAGADASGRYLCIF